MGIKNVAIELDIVSAVGSLAVKQVVTGNCVAWVADAFWGVDDCAIVLSYERNWELTGAVNEFNGQLGCIIWGEDILGTSPVPSE
jgi:hypothetical protein